MAYGRVMLLSNPRVKAWVTTLLQHKDTLERAAGRGKLGEVLGCGHWGCVVDLVGTPYVLKLTVDPTEAHIWQKIVNLTNDEVYGGDGFPRIKKIFKLEPGIQYGRQGRVRTAYGIVREKIVPVFGGRELVTTAFTGEVLGMPHGWTWHETARLARQVPQNYKMQEFATALSALMRYREAAHLWHKYTPYSNYSRHAVLQKAEAAASHMCGSVGGPLGESLSMLASNGVLLRDVHFGNIGWRYLTDVEGEEGYTCLVIFDPGHTPTGKQQLPTEKWRQLAANPVRTPTESSPLLVLGALAVAGVVGWLVFRPKPAAASLPKLSGKALLVGDSLAVGLGPPLAKALAPVSLTTRAHISATTKDWTTGQYASELSPEGAEVVFVSLGTNDTAPGANIAGLEARFKALADSIRKAGATPLFLLPPELPWPRAPISDAIKAASAIMILPRAGLEHAGDKIHLTPKGYADWADDIAKQLKGGVVGHPVESFLL